MTEYARYMAQSRARMYRSLGKYDRELSRLYVDLAGKLKAELSSMPTPKAKLHQVENIKALMAAAKATGNDFKSLIDRAMLEAADIPVTDLYKAMDAYVDGLASVGIDMEKVFHRIPKEAIESLYRRVREDGLRLSQRIWNLDRNTQNGIARIVTEGLTRGLHYDDPKIAEQLTRFLQPIRQGKTTSKIITRKLKDGTEFTFRQRPVSYDAARLLRTEYSNAFRESTSIAAQRNPACAGEQWLLSGTHPDIGCECEEYAEHDEGLGVGVYPVGELPMDSHPNCVVDGTVVSGPRVVGTSTRWYRGEVVEIGVGDGEELTVTPNHPILTPEGWVPAGLLDEGNEIIYCGGRDGRGSPSAVLNPKDKQVPARIEDVVRAFNESSGVVTRAVETTREAFHGDGMSGEVCIIGSDSFLGDSFNASLREKGFGKLLKRGYVQLLLLVGKSALAFDFDRIALTPPRFLSGFSPLTVLLGGSHGMGDALRLYHSPSFNASVTENARDNLTGNAIASRQAKFGLAHGIGVNELLQIGGRPNATHFNPAVSQYTGDGSGGDAILATEFVHRGAGEIFPRDITSIRRYPFSGHVYNLQTVEGWYSSNNIITHNCLCTSIQVLISIDDFMEWVDDYKQTGGGPIADWYKEIAA